MNKSFAREAHLFALPKHDIVQILELNINLTERLLQANPKNVLRTP